MKRITRRTFIKGSVATAAALTPYSRVLGANNDIRVAVVGFRSQGSNHINYFRKIPGVRVVALCDADRAFIDREVKKFKDRNESVDSYVDVRQAQPLDLAGSATSDPSRARHRRGLRSRWWP